MAKAKFRNGLSAALRVHDERRVAAIGDGRWAPVGLAMVTNSLDEVVGSIA